MSVIRQMNLLGQQRVDIPHLRGLESSIANDFDVAVGTIIAGQRPLVVRGFTVSSVSGVGLVMNTAGGVIINYFASEAGSMLIVPNTQPAELLDPSNPNVVGAIAPNTINYVGIDFVRSTDSTTNDTVQFLDASSLSETPRTVPLARTLTYKIVISTTPFSATTNICPVAIINSSGGLTSDARRLLFRLGSGGEFPNIANTYSFPQGRNENTGFSTDLFSGGDKSIGSLKDAFDALTTRIWECSGGGEYWYSPTSPQNVKLVREGAPLSNSDYFAWSGTDLTWQGLRFVFSNAITSTIFYNIISDQTTASPGLTNLALGECIYVDISRASVPPGTTNPTVTAVKGNIQTLGSPAIPGSRYVLAYRGPSGNVFTRDGAVPISNSSNPFLGANRATAQSIASATTTAIVFNTVELDTDTGYNSTTGVYTVPAGKGGHYLIRGQMAFGTAVTGNVTLSITKNTVAQKTTTVVAPAAAATFTVDGILVLVPGDNIDIRVTQSSGGAASLVTSAAANFMFVKRMAN